MKSKTRKSPGPFKTLPAKDSTPQAKTFPVVAIGASAGGLEAYKEFFHALPVDTGMAFVLIQHLDPSHHTLLAEIFSKATRMPVEEVKAGTRLKPNRVYVIPPSAFIAIAAGTFTLTPRSKGAGQHLSVLAVAESPGRIVAYIQSQNRFPATGEATRCQRKQ